MGPRQLRRNTVGAGVHLATVRREKLKLLFDLSELPPQIPHDGERGLELPARLRDLEIRKIAAASAALVTSHSNWRLGDLLLWLKRNPDAPLPYDAVFKRLRRFYAYPPLKNYQSLAKTFPSRRRRPELATGHHDAVRDLPAALQDQLLERAVREGLGANQFAVVVRIEKLKLRRPGRDRILGEALRFMIGNLMVQAKTPERRSEFKRTLKMVIALSESYLG